MSSALGRILAMHLGWALEAWGDLARSDAAEKLILSEFGSVSAGLEALRSNRQIYGSLIAFKFLMDLIPKLQPLLEVATGHDRNWWLNLNSRLASASATDLSLCQPGHGQFAGSGS